MLTFDAGSHEYRWNGEVRPSVTQCLSRLHTFNMVKPEVLQAACERGTYVHALCEFDDQNDLDPASVLPEYQGYLDAWRLFKADRQAVWCGIEWQGYSQRHGYAGTMDRYGYIGPTKDRYVIDIKTSAQPHRVWGMQTAAYRQLLAEQIHPEWALARRATVQLRADGRYNFLAWDDPQDWPAFQALIALMNWSNA